MRNLLMFISKYNAFFLFILFFLISVAIIINNNTYQKASTLNSTNKIIGSLYEKVNHITSYINLGLTNDKLAAENADLRKQLKTSFFDNKMLQKTIIDSTLQQQYTYTEARVVNNSIHQKNNYITINRGKFHGIKRGMGVISSLGVVGIVYNVSNHYATIQSVLNTDSRISASILKSNAFGSLVWGQGVYSPQYAILKDVPNHVIVKKGQKVVTSGFSLFPPGIPVGIVVASDKQGDSFLDIKVKLYTDFSTLQYVYVINNKLSLEQQQLEAQNPKDE